jgi:hypothetical protein
VDDGVSSAFPGRVAEHLLEEDEAAGLDDAEDEDEQQRRHERELDECLPA